jgi:PAS domain S-box-containing protein/diguanylate cyclase (GGDEF)-like protein
MAGGCPQAGSLPVHASGQRAARGLPMNLHLPHLVAGLPGLLYRCRNDADFTTEFVSDGVAGLTGYPAEDFRQHRRHFGRLIHPEDRQRVWDEVQAAVGRRRPFELTYRIATAAGTTQWVWEKGHGVYGAAGELEALEGFITDITGQKQAEAALQESEARFRAYTESAPDAIVIADDTGRIVLVNSQTEALFGYTRAELVGQNVDLLLPESYRARHASHRARYFAAPTLRPMGAARELSGRRKDGSEFPLEISLNALTDKGRIVVCSTIRDISARKAAEAKIRRLDRIHALLSGINSLIVRVRTRGELFDESCRIGVSLGGFKAAWIGLADRGAMTLVPVASAEADPKYLEFIRETFVLSESSPAGSSLIARAIRERRVLFSNDTQSDPAIRFKSEHVRRGYRSLALLPLLVSGDAIGVLALYSDKAGTFDDEELTLLRELAGDISFALEHIDRSEKLERLGYHDALTGLGNRELFQERLDRRVRSSAHDHGMLAVVAFDIERFRTINETLGRTRGDELLRQLAARAGRFVGDPDRLARFEADHFAAIIPEMPDRAALLAYIERGYRDVLGTPFTLGGTELRAACRLGIALFPADGDNADALLRNAEAALKKAKSRGDRYLFYAREMNEGAAEKLALENKLRAALEKDEFVLHYQPKMSMDDRAIVGVEALIRWQSPQLGLVPPAKFIPLLEETGLILQVGAWALRRAALDHRRWSEAGLDAPRVAVNVSAIQVRQRDFVRGVEAAIRDGVSPPGIDLEITESLVMEDIQGNIDKLGQVRALGVNVAIDDFGTGYSSLAYLAKLPVQTLKIDRSFVTTMLSDPDTMTLVQTIVSLAHSLRLKVVAEGVEEEAQAQVLRRLGCDEMQGYLFSVPVPAERIAALLASSRALTQSA